MVLFESGPRKILKKIRKLASEGSVNRVSSTVKEERSRLLEESGVALELIKLLLDIGHPNLAADVGGEVIHRHRQVTGEVQTLFKERLSEFSRSTDLLRAIWKSFIDRHDFKSALNILGEADEIAVSSLFNFIEERTSNSIRFDGTVHPEADQSSLIEWALCLYSNERPADSIDFLWKISRELEFPHRDISILAVWIGNQVKQIESRQLIALMGISALSGKMDQAMQYANQLSGTDLSPDNAVDAADVIEKWLIPADRSGRSSALLAEMFTAAGKTEAASRILEDVYSDSMDRGKLETAIEDLVSHPESGAAPLLLSARMDLENGKTAEAAEAIEKAFIAGGADSDKLIDVCRSLIAATGDTTGPIAMKLAAYLVDIGEVKNAVTSLFPILNSDASWVFEQVQKLLIRDKNSASVLSLLAAVLFETGKKGKAAATLDHLSRRLDKNFCMEAAEVLDSLEDQVIRYPELREARALFRFRSDRLTDAASDWFSMFLTGRSPSMEGRELLTRDGIEVGSLSDIEEANFTPTTSWQAYVAALISLREKNAEAANKYLLLTLDDIEYQKSVSEKISGLSADLLCELDLSSILPKISSGKATETVASILECLGGTEDWKLSIVTELNWGNPAEEAEFRLRYLLAQGKIILAGSSYIDGSIDDALMENIAHACQAAVQDNSAESLELLEHPVAAMKTSKMARELLEYLLERNPAFNIKISELIAISFETEKRFDDLARILSPVLSENGMMDLLEKMHERHPGEFTIIDSLTRASVQTGDFHRFQQYSALMLDLDADSSAELVDMAVSMAITTSSGEAYLYAARTAHRSGIEVDIDDLLIEAVLLKPELSSEHLLAEFAQIGPVSKSICSIAAGDSDTFTNIIRDQADIDIPLTEKLLDIAIRNWSPVDNAEALSGLVRSASSLGFKKQVEEILCVIALEGKDPWDTIASEKLLREVIAGNAGRTSIWKYVKVNRIIAEALERLFPEGYSDIDTEEAKAVAGAVLKSGQGVRRLFKLADDSMLFPPDDTSLRLKLAEACMKNLPDPGSEDSLSPQEKVRLVQILLSAGMLSDAVSIAREESTDELLSLLRSELQEARIKSSASGIEKASILVLSGDAEGALKEIDSLDGEYPDAPDIKALAQWNLGFRNQAISTWLNEYRKTGAEMPLKRLIWAMSQTGATLEISAFRRFLAERHPTLTSLVEYTGVLDNKGGLDLISGLRINPKMKKVNNG
ncbi:MAG: hypothetical protein KAQ97_09410 [Candidatus Fermentibacteraceae bacterium]|nr:hypothetical protein [Candidatus Fermentibacteraceae bacterium]